MRNVLQKLGVLDVYITVDIADVSTAEDVYVPAPVTGVLKKAYCSLSAAITVANTTLTFASASGNISNTMTLAYSGSAPGSTFSATFVNQTNRKVQAGQMVKIACNGGSTTASKGKVVLVFERTRI